MATVISSDLAGALHVSVRTDRFHMSMAQPFRTVFLGALGLHEAYFFSQGIQDPLSLGLVVPAMVLGLSLVGVAVVVSMVCFEVGPQGIRCVDLWWRRQDRTWDEITNVRIVHLLGMRYARIESQGGKRALWLPLFVRTAELLEDSLQLHAPQGHPVHDLGQQLAESA
jgi:hypothetical protein